MLDIDSGGGSVDSVAPMIQSIQKSRSQGKPVVASCDLAASAAYWTASACIRKDETNGQVCPAGAGPLPEPKRIILILLMLPAICFAQNKWFGNNKIQHWTTSTVMSFAGGQILEHTTGWEYSHEAAMFSVILLSTYKEYRMDEKASAKDIAFSAAGAVAGYYISRAINRKIRKWKPI